MKGERAGRYSGLSNPRVYGFVSRSVIAGGCLLSTPPLTMNSSESACSCG